MAGGAVTAHLRGDPPAAAGGHADAPAARLVAAGRGTQLEGMLNSYAPEGGAR